MDESEDGEDNEEDNEDEENSNVNEGADSSEADDEEAEALRKALQSAISEKEDDDDDDEEPAAKRLKQLDAAFDEAIAPLDDEASCLAQRAFEEFCAEPFKLEEPGFLAFTQAGHGSSEAFLEIDDLF